MDRVQASEAWGRGFESHAARQPHTVPLFRADTVKPLSNKRLFFCKFGLDLSRVNAPTDTDRNLPDFMKTTVVQGFRPRMLALKP